MRLKPDELIAGLPAKKIRELFRFYSQGIRAEGIADRLDISQRDAEMLLGEFLKLGFIEPSKDDLFDTGWYSLTIKAGAISNAKFIKPIPREKAKEILSEIISRCAEVNQNEDLTHYVKRLHVFGSFNTDSKDLGDIDIIIETERRPGIGSIVNASLARLRLAGRYPRSYAEELFYGEHEVLRLVKARSPNISLHNPLELEDVASNAVVFFEADPSAVRRARRGY